MTCANHPDRPNTAFCQHCGKPICADCTRAAGSAVFCEPCLADRLNAAKVGPIPPIDTGEPSPVLAAILGLIPGVGAMYNGQYSKGLVHLVVFTLLVSLSHQVDIFGIFVAGWVCYQVIDAYHTARARRDGTPLPNPFGLNDLGDRLGFDRNAAPPPPHTSTSNPPPASGPAPNPTMPPSDYNYTYSYSYPPPPPPPLTDEELAAYRRGRFPAGAIWLIVLGIIFLLGNFHLFPHNSAREIFPVLLIAFGLWAFFRRMTTPTLSSDQTDSALRRMQIVGACSSGFWLVLIGVLWLLDTWNILHWRYSWPIFWIAGGIMLLVRRTAFYGVAAPYPPPPSAPPPTQPGTAIVPAPHYPDQEN